MSRTTKGRFFHKPASSLISAASCWGRRLASFSFSRSNSACPRAASFRSRSSRSLCVTRGGQPRPFQDPYFEENETIIGDRACPPALDAAALDSDDENNAVAPLNNGNIADEDPQASPDGRSETPPSSVARLAARLTDQLVAFRGCCTNCHENSRAKHYRDFEEHTSLNNYLESTTYLCPNVLGDARIASISDDLAGKTDASSRRPIFCGIGSTDTPPHISLGEDERVTDEAAVSLNVDSITGFPTSLAVAKPGIR